MKKDTCQPERGFREKIRDSKFRAKMKGPKAYARWMYFQLRKFISETVQPRLLFIRNRTSWAKTIKGKTVAIVGPAPLDKDYSDLIESHDLIIRVGFEHWPWPETGTRTDVWVLDGQSSREFLDFNMGCEKQTARRGETDPNELERVKRNIAIWNEKGVGWVILKSGSRLRLSEVFKFIFSRKFESTNTHCILSRKPLFLWLRGLDWHSARTHLNQVPIALLELFNLKPKSVAVFGSDYYTRPGLSYGASSPDHQNLVDSPKSFIEVMQKSHPQIHQKRIVRWVQDRRSWPTGDPLFSRLTALDEYEFLKLYRDW